MDRSEIVKIDPNNPDYFAWGRNCRILGMAGEEAFSILCDYEKDTTQDERDLFWEDYCS